MALANMACLLARESKRDILMIDWDLEAPGLHHYFEPYLPKNYRKHEGLIEFFQKAFRELPAMPLDEEQEEVLELFWQKTADYILPIQLPETNGQNLFLLKAGRFDDKYSAKVAGFDWQGFFQKIPSFFLHFSRFLSRKYHYVLIDSRTGHTDTGGICTMLMPEKLVLVFTPNRQSLQGVLDLAHKAVEYRRHSDDTRPLVIYPLPSRVDLGEEKLRREWQEEYTGAFEETFQRIYDLPKNISLNDYFERVQIRHVPRFAYGEEISVLHESPRDINALAFSFQVLKTQLFGTEAIWRINGYGHSTTQESKKVESQWFISYSRKDEIFLERLMTHLTPLVRSLNIKIWTDGGISPGTKWDKEILSQLQRSDVFIMLISPDFLASEYIWLQEFPKMLQRYEEEGALIVPVILRPCLWEDSPVAQFQIIPKVPISIFSDKDEGYYQVVKALKDNVINRIPSNTIKK